MAGKKIGMNECLQGCLDSVAEGPSRWFADGVERLETLRQTDGVRELTTAFFLSVAGEASLRNHTPTEPYPGDDLIEQRVADTLRIGALLVLARSRSLGTVVRASLAGASRADLGVLDAAVELVGLVVGVLSSISDADILQAGDEFPRAACSVIEEVGGLAAPRGVPSWASPTLRAPGPPSPASGPASPASPASPAWGPAWDPAYGRRSPDLSAKKQELRRLLERAADLRARLALASGHSDGLRRLLEQELPGQHGVAVADAVGTLAEADGASLDAKLEELRRARAGWSARSPKRARGSS